MENYTVACNGRVIYDSKMIDEMASATLLQQIFEYCQRGIGMIEEDFPESYLDYWHGKRDSYQEIAALIHRATGMIYKEDKDV